MKHALLRSASLSALLCAVWPSRADVAPAPSGAPAEQARPWLGERTGVAPLERALLGGDSSARERAIERLGALGTARALELLSRALEPSGSAQSPRERLLCVRALGPHGAEAKVRESLVRLMSGISVSAERNEPLHALLRDTAALALASSGEPAALEALGKALRQTGRVAQAAASALLAHPPNDLKPLLASLRTPTPEVVWVLESLGDERAFEPLRQVVRRGGPELSARAALALTRLGNFETVELARHWSDAKRQPALRLAAAEILTLAKEPDAEKLLAELLALPATRADALKIATEARAPSLTKALWAAFETSEAHQAPALLSWLARSGDAASFERLAGLARSNAYGDAAAYALALSPEPRARAALERGLASGTALRRLTRAAVLRRKLLGEEEAPEGLDRALERLLASSEPRDRAVAAFGRALEDADTARALLRANDRVTVEAAARAAPFVGAAIEAADLLARATPGPLRSQLALALVDARARDRVPTRVLLELLVESGPAAPLALFALGERDGEATRPALEEGLASPDAERRVHAALGLAASPEPSAVGLLEAAYRFEVVATVRHAIVTALAQRSESVRRRTLELAARLDPDASVRNAASLGLAGVRPSAFSRGVGAVWLVVEARGPERAAVKLEVPGGLALPVLTDPDGVVALAGLPAGPIAVRLARGGVEGNAQAPAPERR